MSLKAMLILSFTAGAGNGIHGSEQIIPMADIKTCYSYRKAYIETKQVTKVIHTAGDTTITIEVDPSMFSIVSRYTLTCVNVLD